MSKNLMLLFELLIIYFKKMQFYLFSHMALSSGLVLVWESSTPVAPGVIHI